MLLRMLLPKKLKAFTSATIKDNMLILNSQSKFRANRCETRVMFDKISSVDFSIVFGEKSARLLSIAAFLYAAAIGLLVGILAFGLDISLIYFFVALVFVGFILFVLAFILREHAIKINCGGDTCSLCMGRKTTDEVYNHICAVLAQIHANDMRR